MMKDRLDGDKEYLVHELVKVQEEANALAFAKVAAEAELAKAQKGLKTVRLDAFDCVDRLGHEFNELRVQKSADSLDVIDSHEKKEQISELSGISDRDDMKEQADKVLQDPEIMESQWFADEKLLDWEKSNNYALRQKIERLQEKADTAAHARLTAENDPQKLCTGTDSATNSSAEDLASQLQQQVGALQEERQTTFEQVKALENIIASGEIKVDEAAQLREVYIIKLKRDICMLETNVNNFSEENKAHVNLQTETKGDEIREEIDDNAIRIISVQSKALKGHAAKLKEKLKCALKEANDAKLAQKEVRL